MSALVRMVLTFDLTCIGDQVGIPISGQPQSGPLDFPLCRQWLEVADSIGTDLIEVAGHTAAAYHEELSARVARVRGMSIDTLENATIAKSMYNPRTKAWDPVPSGGRVAFLWRLKEDVVVDSSMMLRYPDLQGGISNVKIVPRVQVQAEGDVSR